MLCRQDISEVNVSDSNFTSCWKRENCVYESLFLYIVPNFDWLYNYLEPKNRVKSFAFFMALELSSRKVCYALQIWNWKPVTIAVKCFQSLLKSLLCSAWSCSVACWCEVWTCVLWGKDGQKTEWPCPGLSPTTGYWINVIWDLGQRCGAAGHRSTHTPTSNLHSGQILHRTCSSYSLVSVLKLGFSLHTLLFIAYLSWKLDLQKKVFHREINNQ